jgi:hypothetical protein
MTSKLARRAPGGPGTEPRWTPTAKHSSIMSSGTLLLQSIASLKRH